MKEHPVKVLAVEDDPETIEFFQVALGKENKIVQAATGEQALDLFFKEKPDIVLMDVLMPSVDGFTIARRIKATKEGRRTPIIFVSAKSDKLSILTGLEVGALDYIAKPFDARELIMKVRSVLRFVEMNKSREAELEPLTLIDELTMLYNRRYLTARFIEEFERARRYDAVFSVLLIDIDDFGEINGKHGRAAGDRVLKMIADILRGMVRKSDAVVRYGPDDFLIIATETAHEGADMLARRIEKKVLESPLKVDDDVIACSVSIGYISTEDPRAHDQPSMMDLVERVIRAVEKGGRGRILSAREMND